MTTTLTTYDVAERFRCSPRKVRELARVSDLRDGGGRMSTCLNACIVSDDEGHGYWCDECPDRRPVHYRCARCGQPAHGYLLTSIRLIPACEDCRPVLMLRTA